MHRYIIEYTTLCHNHHSRLDDFCWSVFEQLMYAWIKLMYFCEINHGNLYNKLMQFLLKKSKINV